MARPTFTTLPAEIRSIILEFVCTEDIIEHKEYKEALSLCLVSKQTCTLTLPILYRVLFATGRSCVNLLSRTLREHPERSRFVRHIFLSDRQWSSWTSNNLSGTNNDQEVEYEVLPDFAFTFPTTQQGRIQRRTRMHSWLTARAEMLSTFEKSVADIVTVAAPRLHSLTVLLYSKYHRKPVRDPSEASHQNIHLDAQGMDASTQDCSGKAISDILALEYPRLRDLTIREESLSICRPKLKMPALHRMQLAGGEITLPAATLAAAIAGCPSLAHIRWTIASVTVALAEALEWFFGIWVLDEHRSKAALEECTVSTSAAHSTTHLQHFHVQIQRRVGKSSNPSASPPTHDHDAYLSIAVEQRLIALSRVAPMFELCDAPSQSPAGAVYPLETAAAVWSRQLQGYDFDALADASRSPQPSKSSRIDPDSRSDRS